MNNNFALVLHGGAGTILKKDMTPEKENKYIYALELALKVGFAILRDGGTAVDAVEATVKVLEDHPLFNAGKGSVFTHDGMNELDAAIMDGRTLNAGAVAQVTTIKNPISAARLVMEQSQHILMVGKGAEKFAAEVGLELVDFRYFFTEERWEQLQIIKSHDSELMMLDHDSTKHTASIKQPGNHDEKYGTVGAVALDRQGNLAAATSTGGMTNKKFGRVGDSPIIGAGTYANNHTCAVSCTGWGEFFLRTVAAKTVSDLMEYRNWSLRQATEDLIFRQIPDLGGDGGLIAVDKDGNIAMPFNTEGMYRGFADQYGNIEVQIYKE
jgi:beta-aspartyl-peptidase (threonine type)